MSIDCIQVSVKVFYWFLSLYLSSVAQFDTHSCSKADWEKNRTKSDFFTQPRDASSLFAYKEVVDLLGGIYTVYIFNTQAT